MFFNFNLYDPKDQLQKSGINILHIYRNSPWTSWAAFVQPIHMWSMYLRKWIPSNTSYVISLFQYYLVIHFKTVLQGGSSIQFFFLQTALPGIFINCIRVNLSLFTRRTRPNFTRDLRENRKTNDLYFPCASLLIRDVNSFLFSWWEMISKCDSDWKRDAALEQSERT